MATAAPEITVSHIVAAGAKEKPVGLSEGLNGIHQRVEDLRKFFKSGREGFVSVKEGRKETQFTAEGDGQALRKVFGNGEGHLTNLRRVSDVDTGIPIMEYKGPRNEVAESLASAESITKPLTTYLRYAELVDQYNKAKGTAGENKFFAENKLHKDQWENMRKEALTFLMNTGNLKDGMPELKGMKEEDQLKYLEQTLGSDPELRKEVKRRMSEIFERASVAKKAEYSDPQLETDKAAKEKAERERKDARGKIDDVIGRYNLVSTSSDVTTMIDARMTAANGFNVDNTLVSLRQELISKNGLGPVAEYKQVEAKYLQAINDRNVLQAQIEALQNELDGPGNLLHERANEIKRQRTILLGKKVEKDGEIGNMDAKKKQYDDTVSDDKLKQYDAIMQATSSGEDGQPAGEIALHLKEYAFNAKNAHDLTAKIDLKERELKKSGDEQLGIRLREEAQWIEELESIMPDALDDILLERRDMLVESQNKEIADATTERGETAQKLIREAMEKRWVSKDRDSRRRKVNKDNIKDDLQTMIYSGPEDGIRRLIIRDLWTANPPVLKGGYGGYTYDNMPLTLLNEQDKALVDEAVGTMGEAYKQRLFTDFLTARGMTGLNPFANRRLDLKVFGHGAEVIMSKTALKSHEEQMLEEQYGQYLNLSVMAEGSEKGRKIVEALKQQGLDSGTDKKKWLQAFLAALIAVPAVVVGTGTGIAPALAVGAAVGALRGATPETV